MNWASNPCAYMHANNLCNQEANNVHVEEQGNHTIAVARLLLLLGPRGMHLVTAKEKPQLSAEQLPGAKIMADGKFIVSWHPQP